MKSAQVITLCGICVWLIYIFALIALQVTVKDAISQERQQIALEMKDFVYINRSSDILIKEELANYTPETNGTPIRSMIISTWESGSEFLGGILNAMPGNYFHYSALMNFGHKSIQSYSVENEALNNLENLFYCNYSEMRSFMEFGQRYYNFYARYGRLRHTCNQYPQFCWSPIFLSQYCQLFPFQSMTVENLRLAPLEKLINNNTSLNVRILLLIRDPRGTMQARKQRNWCRGNPDCDNPETLCSNLVEDYQTAEELVKKYPQRFRTLRYEDISINPYEITKEILLFFGLPFNPQVEKFLDIHTKVNVGAANSTFRDPKSVTFYWKQSLMIEEIKNIQNKCTKAMELWGYRKVEEFYDFERTFDPLMFPPPFA